MSLNVYEGSDKVDHIVAESPEDAQTVYVETYGEPDHADDILTWELQPDDKPLTISYEDEEDLPEGLSPDYELIIKGEGRPHLTLTCREWADRNGRGILCSTEW